VILYISNGFLLLSCRGVFPIRIKWNLPLFLINYKKYWVYTICKYILHFSLSFLMFSFLTISIIFLSDSLIYLFIYLFIYRLVILLDLAMLWTLCWHSYCREFTNGTLIPLLSYYFSCHSRVCISTCYAVYFVTLMCSHCFLLALNRVHSYLSQQPSAVYYQVMGPNA